MKKKIDDLDKHELADALREHCGFELVMRYRPARGGKSKAMNPMDEHTRRFHEARSVAVRFMLKDKLGGDEVEVADE